MNKLDTDMPTRLPTDVATHLPNKPVDKLVVENLHLQYGDNPILKGVSMTLNPGEVVALLGASGSGKTTLLRSVAGLEQPSRGRTPLARGALRWRDPESTCRSKSAIWAWCSSPTPCGGTRSWSTRGYGCACAEFRQAGSTSASIRRSQLGLGALAKRLPQLSGGQQQRVRDCPRAGVQPAGGVDGRDLSNLDAKLREEARAWLRELIVRLASRRWW